MSNFIYDNLDLPFPKANLRGLPSGQDPAKYVVADDWNRVCQAAIDMKVHLRGAPELALAAQATDPQPAGVTSYIWLKSTGELFLVNNGTTTQLNGGGGGGGGGGSDGSPQRFRYTASGSEGSDFTVTLPVARSNANYNVAAHCQGVASIIGFDLPTSGGDRTTTQFRVVTTASLTAGDVLYFEVKDPV